MALRAKTVKVSNVRWTRTLQRPRPLSTRTKLKPCGRVPQAVLMILGAPVRGRKVYSPEIRRGRIEFKRDMKTIRHLPRWPGNLAIDALFCASVFQHQACIKRQALVQHDDRTVRIHAQRGHVERRRLPLKGHVNAGADPQQHALRSAAFLVGDGVFQLSCLRGGFRRRCNRSLWDWICLVRLDCCRWVRERSS